MGPDAHLAQIDAHTLKPVEQWWFIYAGSYNNWSLIKGFLGYVTSNSHTGFVFNTIDYVGMNVYNTDLGKDAIAFQNKNNKIPISVPRTHNKPNSSLSIQTFFHLNWKNGTIWQSADI